MAYPRSFPVLASGALAIACATAAPAFAEGAPNETTTSATTEIQERASIQSTGEVIFQDIAIVPNVTIAPTIDSTSNSQITVLGQGGDAVSLAVPGAIDMTNSDGEQSLTIVTNADGSYSVPIMQGTLSSNGVLSVNVGGTLQVAADQLQPGEYRGVLVVVAQYN